VTSAGTPLCASFAGGVDRVTVSNRSADAAQRYDGSDAGYVVVRETAGARILHVSGFSTGAAARLGRYSLVVEHTIDLEALTVTDGSFALTAADGDVLRGVHEGRASLGHEPGIVLYAAVGTVTEAEGRFAGASGRLAFAAVADLATAAFGQTIAVALIPKEASLWEPFAPRQDYQGGDADTAARFDRSQRTRKELSDGQ
jgi:autotransporter adhesin